MSGRFQSNQQQTPPQQQQQQNNNNINVNVNIPGLGNINVPAGAGINLNLGNNNNNNNNTPLIRATLIHSSDANVFMIPPIWKRIVAETLDFMILFILKVRNNLGNAKLEQLGTIVGRTRILFHISLFSSRL